MGKKTQAAKSSLAVLFVAAGGASATSATAAANPDAASIQGIVSSYFGPLGLQDSFASFVKDAGYPNFLQWWKISPGGARCGVDQFSAFNKVAPPLGLIQFQKCDLG